MCASSTKWLSQPTRSRARSLMPSSNRPRWKSTRSSSGPRRRISEVAMKLGTIARNSALLLLIEFTAGHLEGQERIKIGMSQHVFYGTVKVDGLSIFYREAGPKDAPALFLLQGLPSSSRMFEPLFARLSDRYHLVAPDYPGFGHSDWPDPQQFAYTFDHITAVIDVFTQALGVSHYTLYMQDYGGPVGFRLVLAHPERVQALIFQNAVAHNDGLGAIWATRRAVCADRAAHEAALREDLLSLAAPKIVPI